MSLSQIRNFDYAILLCNKMEETRTFYRGVGAVFALVRRC